MIAQAMVVTTTLLWGGAARGDEQRWPTPERPVSAIVERPAKTQLLACSFRESVCVHADRAAFRSLDSAAVTETLRVAEHALQALRALGLPGPRDDGDLGGNHAFDLYLLKTASTASSYADPRLTTTSVDQTSAFAILPADPPGPRCAAASGLTRALAQGVLLGLDAAQHSGTLALHSSYLASLISPCHPLEAAAIDRFQRTPELALTVGHPDRFEGTMLLSSYLDATYGVGKPGAVMSGLIATSTQHTPAVATHWRNEPDIFDALREVLPRRGEQFGDLLTDFAVARAFVGSRSDGAHLPDTERFGDLGRVRFEWSVGYDSLPRRVGPLRPVQPTGATYLWLDLAKAEPHSGVLFVAEWEESFVFQWCLVRVDAEGREIGRSTIGGVFGKHLAQQTINDLGDAAGLLIVGTSLGNDDRSNPFDPDVGPPREAAYEVTLHAR